MDTLTRRRLFLLAPLAVAAGAGGAATALLLRMQEGRYDPHALPSMLVGKRLPAFSLPGQPPSTGFSAADVTAQGQPALVNFFASWCLPCAQEAPALAAVQRDGVRIWGIAYKDAPEATTRFLDRYGNPYVRVARDPGGTTGIDFGLYGVPESFLVDATGVVRWRWTGGLSADSVRQDLLPRLRALS
jgi:cytochrome c biogenesis protein CcmG/thiol:disulfide interchange protein DsbE